ncbi:SHOCT domain-containing protein [Catenulispora subtropica]|uniref:SHOCT domain-containing protein n=1 Tax=Catenulispora subtropica TaxID=450798 RepID=A0ABN2QY88_9ACTN
MVIGRARVRRGPGLVGAAARTAVVAGTATAVSGRVRRRQDERSAQAEQEAAYEQQQQAAPPAAPEASGSDNIAELERLAALKQQGVLTDEEFAAAKAKVLGL